MPRPIEFADRVELVVEVVLPMSALRKYILWPFVAGAIVNLNVIGCMYWVGRPEVFARDDLPRGRSVVIYSEGALTDPPHGLDYEVVEGGRTLVSPDRRGHSFLNVGETRAPQITLRLVTAEGGDLVGLIYPNNNVVMMYEFRGHQTWPEFAAADRWKRYTTGMSLFRRLSVANPGLRSHELDQYRRFWVASPDSRLFIADCWEGRQVGGAHNNCVRIRIADSEAREVCTIEADLRVDSRTSFGHRWAAGWMGDETVVFTSTVLGTHAWKVNADGSSTELPAPLGDDLRSRAQELLDARSRPGGH